MKSGPGRIIMLVIALLLLVALLPKACAQVMLPHRNSIGISDPCDKGSYIVMQNFEGTGYDHCETWSEVSTPDPDYTGVVLEGAQSLRIQQSGSSVLIRKTFTGMSEVWAYFLLHPVTRGVVDDRSIMRLNSSIVDPLIIWVKSNGRLMLQIGGITATTVDSISDGTTYDVWCYYKQGSGANAIGSVGFATNGTKPVGGNKFASIANGTATGLAISVEIGSGQTVTQEYVYDKVRVSATTIGDNPP